jgi:phage repressor protein C with HTH and peptisase S24 domain
LLKELSQAYKFIGKLSEAPMSRLARPAEPLEEGGGLTHANIWNALDALAARFGMSPSGLAKRAGLDATTFNRSKRRTVDGRLRWPSTESLSKVLHATGSSLDDFVALIGARHARPEIGAPLFDLSEIAERSSLLELADAGRSPDRRLLEFPPASGRDWIAVAVSGEAWPPCYCAGSLLLISLGAAWRTGDRILLKPIAGPAAVARISDASADSLTLQIFDAKATELRLPLDHIAWAARIMWSSQ